MLESAASTSRKLIIFHAAVTILAAIQIALPDASAAELLVCGYVSDAVTRHDATSGAPLGTLQSGVGLNGPLCARIGPDGLLYVTSELTNSVQRYNVNTGAFVDTFVTPGSGGLNGPTGLTWDADGNLIVPSFNTNTILKYNGQSGAFLGNFVTAGSGGLSGPDNGAIFGPDGNLYVPSYFGNKILRYNGRTGAFLDSFISSIFSPRVLEFHGSSLYVTSEGSNCVRRFDATTGVAQGNFTAPGSGGMQIPIGMAFGPDGNLYVASSLGDSVLRYNGATGAFMDTFITSGSGGIDTPAFLTFTPEPATGLCALAWLLLVRPRHAIQRPDRLRLQ